jgi:hypothetical protein
MKKVTKYWLTRDDDGWYSLFRIGARPKQLESGRWYSTKQRRMISNPTLLLFPQIPKGSKVKIMITVEEVK